MKPMMSCKECVSVGFTFGNVYDRRKGLWNFECMDKHNDCDLSHRYCAKTVEQC